MSTAGADDEVRTHVGLIEELGEDVLAGNCVIDCPTVEHAVEIAARIRDAATSDARVHYLLDLDAAPAVPRPPARR